MVARHIPLLKLSHTGTIMINWTDPKNLVELDDSTANVLHNWLKSVLHETSVIVTFTKADGTERVMNCTLSPDKLPEVEPKPIVEGKQPRKESTTSIRVFDLDKKEWRSFTTKKIKRIEFDIVGHTGD